MALVIKSVLITDDVDPKCVAILKNGGVDVCVNTKLAKDKPNLLLEIPKYDGLIVRSATKVTADVIEASNLKIIGRAGTGTDNIDSAAATRKGVIVMNTPGGNTISAAELTCTMICGLSRNVAKACQSMKEGRWDRKLFMGQELLGKTLAIVGLGRIGREVGSRMRSFGMKTIGYDPLVSPEQSAAFDVTSYPLEELWPMADYITVHVPLLPSTKNLINKDVLYKCKKGVKIVNCARGGIIDEAALLEALQSGQCGGAGLDVYDQEPPTNLDLVQHANVIATPHLGASTVEAQSRVAEEIAQQFLDARDGKSLFGAINANVMVQALSKECEPFMDLGKGLGTIVGAVSSSPISVVVQGDSFMKSSLAFMEASVAIGALSSKFSGNMNLVNAPTLAKESGLEVKASYVESAFNCVTVRNDSISVVGVVQGRLAVLASINDASGLYTVLAAEKTYMLVLGTQDASAVLGQVSANGVAVQAMTSFGNNLLLQLSGVTKIPNSYTFTLKYY